jgi:hypothetical protein
LPHSVISEQTTKYLETLAKLGISGQIKEKQNNDKNTFRLPRQAIIKGLECSKIGLLEIVRWSFTWNLLILL